MNFSLALVSAFVSFVLAQTGPNAFTNTDYSGIAAGKSVPLKWTPSTGGTVSLILRSGNSAYLQQGMPIASNIPNSGSYTWNVPSDILRGSSYTVEIVADGNPSETNYTPQFNVDSPNNAAPTSSSASASSSMSSSASSSSMSSSSMMSSSSSSRSSSASSTATTRSMTMSSSSAAATSPAAAATTSATTNGAAPLNVAGWSLAGALVGALAL